MPIGRSVTGFTVVGRRKGSLFFCGAKCRDWHIASIHCAAKFGRYRVHSGHWPELARNTSVVNDPTATLAVHWQWF
jgi:hypothetical protein